MQISENLIKKIDFNRPEKGDLKFKKIQFFLPSKLNFLIVRRDRFHKIQIFLRRINRPLRMLQILYNRFDDHAMR